ncbi:MAG: hypothetical protein Kow00109_26580 [Acidobacteriota bacterium]
MKVPEELQRVLPLILCLAAVPARVPAAPPEYPPRAGLEEVRAAVGAAAPDHPRLFASARQWEELRRQWRNDPFLRRLGEALLHQADRILVAAPVERVLEGRRLLGVSRTCLKRVGLLAAAFHLTQDERYLERCRREMLAAATFSDWNPSHFLDTAEMAFALGVGYDWLYDYLAAADRATLRRALVEKALDFPRRHPDAGWITADNNWGQVCHGGLVTAALAILEDEPELAAETVHRAVHNVTHAMRAYAPKGAYPEGPDYWEYGTTYNVLLIAALESALGTDFGLSEAPGFAETGQYPALVTGPSGEFFNYADGDPDRSPMPALFWLARRYERPDWLLGEPQRVQALLDRWSREPSGAGEQRFLPFLLFWAPGLHDTGTIRLPLHWYGDGEVLVTVHRTAWNDPDAVYVGFKGGSPAANHGHMDVGSFILEAGGVRWAVDLGKQNYHSIESLGMNLWDRSQDSDRWRIFRLNNFSHNTLVIDDRLQRADSYGWFIRFSDDPAAPGAVQDLTEVYPGAARRILRGIRLLPAGAVLIQDELEAPEAGTIRWQMLTRAAVRRVSGRLVVLASGGKTLELTILDPPEAQWEVTDVSKPAHPWDAPNPGTQRISFTVAGAGRDGLTLRVLARPGSSPPIDPGDVPGTPLEQWPGRLVSSP